MYPYDSLQLVGETERHWRFLCPFHTEKEGSFVVNKTSPFPLFYRCFGCGENGSPQHFAKKYLQHDNPIIMTTKQPYKEIKRKEINWDTMRGCPLEHIPYEEFSLAEKVGISRETIRKYEIGWANDRFYIPMYDDRGICGVATRSYIGDKCLKKCRRYSKHGWFYALNQGFKITDPIFVTEGWSDTAVITELGFHSIGRFNALHIDEHIELADKPRVYIISDTDECGVKGSQKLQKLIGGKIIYPPNMVDKDIRETYLRCGKEETRKWLKKQL